MEKLTYNKIILVAIGVIIGITIYPPFIAKNGTGKVFNMGYHFIFSPPIPLATVNTSMLLIQLFVVSLITVAICFLKSRCQ